MATRKIATLYGARGEILSTTPAVNNTVNCRLTLFYGDASRVEAAGSLDKWQLHSLARFALDGLAQVEAQERAAMESTRRLAAGLAAKAVGQ